MPVTLVDPTVQAEGSLPASPIARMLGNTVAAYGRQFPTQLESSEIGYRNAEKQKLEQEMSAPQQLQDLFTRAYAKQQPVPENYQPSGNFTTPPPAPKSRDQLVSDALPELAGTLAKAGQYGAISNMFRTITANAPGITAVSNDPQHPSPVSMSMLGAGDAYASTPDASQIGFTPGQRDRNSKIASILANNPSATPQQAANIVDGVLDYPQDPTTKNIFEVNKVTGEQRVLKQGNAQVPTGGTGGVSSAATGTGPKNNNPFNLRPVGATSGFQNFQTPEEGLMAGMNDLAIKLSGQSKAMGGKPVTLRNIVSTYSPPNENNTNALIQRAAARMGVEPDAPLNLSHLVPLSQAILAQEGNSGTMQIPQGAAAAPAPSASGFTLKRGDLGIP